MTHTDNQHADAMYYSALVSRDPRFDGVFYVGVTSTGIYCRPVCTAKKPRLENCRFFSNAAAAEKEAFRPCLKCRPELAPGYAPLDDAQRIASRITHYIEEHLTEEGVHIERMAEAFEVSTRQLRRIVHQSFGVSPLELVMTHRLLLAKQLLTETSLPVTGIAFASGFSSVRRFNDAFSKQYGMPPSRLRKDAAPKEKPLANDEVLTIQLTYRPPLDWEALLAFLEAHAIPHIEAVHPDSYVRSVQVGKDHGWIRARHLPQKAAVLLDIPHVLSPVLSTVIRRVRALFDLNARPHVIKARLLEDPLFATVPSFNEGLRMPGAFAGFEMAVRTILGQQITLKAANTLSGRFVHRFGTSIATAPEPVSRLFPTPAVIAEASVDNIASLGIIARRANSILALSRDIAEGRLILHPSAPVEETIQQLLAIPGIGPWTAEYIAMRALHWPDAFPKEDIALRRVLGDLSPGLANKRSQAWRPWRSYASMHLWRMYMGEYAA